MGPAVVGSDGLGVALKGGSKRLYRRRGIARSRVVARELDIGRTLWSSEKIHFEMKLFGSGWR